MHRDVRDLGGKVYLMEGVYVYHWYRADTGGRPAVARDISQWVTDSAPPTEQDVPSTTATRPAEPKNSQLHETTPRHAEGATTLLEQVPISAQSVLCVGRDAGVATQRLKRRQRAVVTAIMSQKPTEEAAGQNVDELVIGDLENIEPDFARHSFDCAVLPGVLERTGRPQGILRRLHDWLGPDGCLLAEVSNLRHHRTISSLMSGRWKPDGAGGAVRFFTRREIEKLFHRSSFEIREIQPVRNPELEQWRQQRRQGEVKIGGLHMTGLSSDEAEEFYVEKYLLRATPVEKPDYGLTSIVILTRNQLPYTRSCLESIRFRTDEPYELIVVDNGSTDGTVEYLRSQRDVKLIENKENRGFPAGCNQGIREAKGDQILLLNNDVIVTTGWLDRLLRALHADPTNGLVGPCTNAICGPQQVPVSYTDLASLDGFAWEWGKTHDRVLEDTDRLVGFCLLLRRTLVDEVGLLDERFGLGNFEDDDYCRRARQAGHRTVIARDAFIHHFGSVTHRAEGIDLAALLDRNERLYHDKWKSLEVKNKQDEAEASPRVPEPKPRFAIRLADGGGLLLERSQIKLSLCMIVRDNARTIEACLNSIKPWVDEMVVVDTGSKDNTPELVRGCSARIFHFPWCDDFAAARNESIRHARGDWIFWMDSDDVIEPENGRKLRELAMAGSGPSIFGYVMQVHCPDVGGGGQTEVTVVDHVKLIRNRPDLRFEGRIHEQILPAIRRAGGEVAFTDVYVVHAGADHSPQGRQKKLDRDYRLLQLDLQDRPNHPFVLFNLGMTHSDAEKHEKAVEALRRSIEVSHPCESHLRKAYALLVGSYRQLGRYDEAWQVCQKGRQLYPEDPELLFREGILQHHFGRLPEAERAYCRALENRGPRHFSSIDHGIVGFKTRHNLALVYEDMDDLPSAEEQWRRVVKEAPTYRSGWRGLGEILLRQGKLEALESQSQWLLTDGALPDFLRGEAMILQGRAALGRGELAAARQLFEEVVNRWPDELHARHALCQLLFEHGEPIETERALRELLQRTPGDRTAHHNLGTIYLRMGQHENAVDAYRESLRHRPDSPATHFHLGCALKATGRVADAAAAWRSVLRLNPGDSAATRALREIETVCDD